MSDAEAGSGEPKAEVAVEVKPIQPEGALKAFIAASDECYWCGHIDKINRHFKKDKRIMSMGKKDGNATLAVYPVKEPKAKREISFGHIESIVVCKTEEVTGLLSKTKKEAVQVLIRMMPKCGDKDFLLNLNEESGNVDEALKLMSDIFKRERDCDLPCTDLRKEANAPADLRDWLNQAGLED
eukprot:TRINITY_DN10034_c0_g1_i1.p1 TRINITY_DN10034_c0_g1~~TRINITY_DN10034_c0_g1_i1.p1  ORF type:complete len:197 (+),score=53.41 TRINITY_DN10034_c0_g1_i1:45-593(+)